jgi:hypothetical protein
MLQKLRSLSSDAKKKVVISCAGSLTLVVFAFWIAHFSGIFSETLSNTKEKGAVVFSAIEENVGKVYNAFEKIIPKEQADNRIEINSSSTSASSTTEIATTTSATTTVIMVK